MTVREEEPQPDRQPWQRQPREPQRAYAGYCVYRDLGTDRTLTAAVRHWLTAPADRSQTKRAHEQRRYETHEKPQRYLRAVRGRWGIWSSRWHWVDRCRAFDEHAGAEAEHRAFEARVEQQLADQREREEEAKRTRVGARTLKLVGQQLALEVGQALAAGEHRRILKCEQCGYTMGEDRLRALLPHLAKAAAAFDVGAKHERLELRQPTDVLEIRGDTERTMKQVVELMREFVPPERWQDFTERLEGIEAA